MCSVNVECLSIEVQSISDQFDCKEPRRFVKTLTTASLFNNHITENMYALQRHLVGVSGDKFLGVTLFLLKE